MSDLTDDEMRTLESGIKRQNDILDRMIIILGGSPFQDENERVAGHVGFLTAAKITGDNLITIAALAIDRLIQQWRKEAARIAELDKCREEIELLRNKCSGCSNGQPGPSES